MSILCYYRLLVNKTGIDYIRQMLLPKATYIALHPCTQQSYAARLVALFKPNYKAIPECITERWDLYSFHTEVDFIQRCFLCLLRRCCLFCLSFLKSAAGGFGWGRLQQFRQLPLKVFRSAAFPAVSERLGGRRRRLSQRDVCGIEQLWRGGGQH